MSQLLVKSATPADGTFSATGTTVWNAGMSPTSGQLTAAFGGTGVDGSAAGNGTIPIGNGSGFSLGSLTAGTNVTITPGAGSITIAATNAANSGPTFPGGIPMTGVKYPRASGSNLATGDNDIYTVPANKRAFILADIGYNNSGVGNIVWNVQVKISGTYYRLGANITTTNGNQSNTVNGLGYIAEAGEILSVHSATNNGLNVWFRILEFDNTSAVFSAKLTSVTSGNQTIYTVPASTTAFILDNQGMFDINTGSGITFINSSGGVVNGVNAHIVPSGQSVGTGFLTNAVQSVNDATRSACVLFATMSAGDFVNLVTTTTASNFLAYIHIMEIT